MNVKIWITNFGLIISFVIIIWAFLTHNQANYISDNAQRLGLTYLGMGFGLAYLSTNWQTMLRYFKHDSDTKN